MANSDTSMTLSSVTGLPTGTGVTLVIDATNASGQPTPSVKEVVTGVVSGSQVVNLNRGQDGSTQQAHSTGASVVMWITANLWNDFQSAFLANHGQLHGYHKSLTDPNGNPWIDQVATTSAVNRLQVANAAAGNGIGLSAVGSDTNIDIDLTPKGTGKVVVPNGTISSAALSNPYKFNVYGSPPANYFTNAGEVVPFSAKGFDTNNNFNTSTYTYTVPVSGFYWFNANLQINNGPTDGYVVMDLYKNSTANPLEQDWQPATAAATNVNMHVTALVQLNVGDTVFVSAGRGGSGGWGGNGGSYNCNFKGFLVSQI
jgi:hypothetical protein